MDAREPVARSGGGAPGASEHPGFGASTAPSRAANPGAWIPYVAPMAVFLALTQLAQSRPGAYAPLYVLKTVAVGGLLLFFRRSYASISWRALGWGVLVGVAVLVAWIGIERFGPAYPRPARVMFDPRAVLGGASLDAFFAVRLAGAAVVVPFMEELFWRDFLWRWTSARGDFRRGEVGAFSWRALVIVSALFAAAHTEWLSAAICGLAYGALLTSTRSLGACVVAHATTNLLLGVYVIRSGDWVLW
jgi:hypothetical protein